RTTITAKDSQRFAGEPVPQLDRTVLAPRRKEAVRGAERDRVDGAFVSPEHVVFLVPREFPQPDRPIVPRRGKHRVFADKRNERGQRANGEGAYRTGVSPELGQLLPRLQVPYSHGAIVARRGKRAASFVGEEGHGVDSPGVSPE